MKWNDCEIIFEDGNLHEKCSPGTKIFQAYLKYCNNVLRQPKLPVWYDMKENVCFGLEQTWHNSNSRHSFFISDKDDFLKDERWGKEFVLNYFGEIFGKDVVENNEVIYRKLPQLESIKNSKVLVIGGGPTTKTCEWQSDDYDHILSCNHFFLNEKIKNINVSLATVTTEVDLSENNVEFNDYMNKNSTIICFEDRFVEDQRTGFEYMKEKYPNRTMYAHTRYRGKIGSAPRLLCLATLLGAKQIDIVGMDGFKKGVDIGDDNLHSFEKGKVTQGTHDYHLYIRHYVALWDYLLNHIGKEVKFRNLGENNESNMSADISRQMFPMEANKR